MNCLALATRRPALLLACSLRASSTAGHAAEFGGLYVPPAQHGVSTAERSVFYTEAAQLQREVKLLIRQPLGAPLPMPVMLWLHGGADGKRSAATSMVEWSETTARAGYYSVSIAHAHRESGSRQLLCGVLGIADDATCNVFRYLNWDRPHDIRAVLDEVVRLGAGTLGGQVDPNRIAVGGHSAGAGGALAVAGASRIFVGAPMQIADPRPIAFLAFSPQQPGSEGFFDTRFQKERHSWTNVHRPVLSATGDGDSTCEPGSEPIGDTLFGRRIPFQRMPVDGNKYHLYLHSASAFHTLFELKAAKCPQPQAVRWLSSAGLAFLDGHVRQLPDALQWLQSNRIEQASGGVAEWQRKLASWIVAAGVDLCFTAAGRIFAIQGELHDFFQ